MSAAAGLTGSAPGAPFHGFTIFLDKSSCIVFLIQLRVTLPEDQQSKGADGRRWIPVKIGDRMGIESSAVQHIGGVEYLNTSVLLGLPRGEDINDMALLFVTPIAARSRTEGVFRSFLRSFKFY